VSYAPAAIGVGRTAGGFQVAGRLRLEQGVEQIEIGLTGGDGNFNMLTDGRDSDCNTGHCASHQIIAGVFARQLADQPQHLRHPAAALGLGDLAVADVVATAGRLQQRVERLGIRRA